MAQSYQLIAAQTLTSGAQTVTFSNIPQNYTDLKIIISARVNTSGGYSNIQISLNGSTSNITWLGLYGYSGSLTGSNSSSTTRITGNGNATSTTSNTFSNVEITIANYTSSSPKSISAEAVVESNDNTNNVLSFDSVLWNPGTQAAITSITFGNSASPAADFMANSTFYLYGVGGTRATGGTITADGAYTYHTFTSTSTFTANEKIKNAEVLLIAGGGGGGANHGGGGGAGGLLYRSFQTLNAGTTYTALIGSGGVGATYNQSPVGSSGNSSIFGNLSATGGGRGGDWSAGYAAADGGSGGGAYSSVANYNGKGVVGQGNDGGLKNPNYSLCGGGGGGAGGVGQTATTANAGAGGVGSSAFSSWGSVTSTGQNVSGVYYYAGGGGGGGWNGSIPVGTIALGGYGGGGQSGPVTDGAASNGTAGTANTGGGGGCGGGGSSNGGAGGSGLVIIRYPNS